MSDPREAWCAATMFSGSLCTRPAGHEGHHFHRDPWAEGSPDIREALVARQREEYGESWDVLVPEVGWTLGRIIESVIEDALPTGHDHKWQRRQNVTSRGYRMPPYEVCVVDGCDAARQVRQGGRR